MLYYKRLRGFIGITNGFLGNNGHGPANLA